MTVFRLLVVCCLLVTAACTTQTKHTVVRPLAPQAAAPSGQTSSLTCPKTLSVVDKSVKSFPLNEMDDRMVESAAQEILADNGPELAGDGEAAELQVAIERAYVHGLATSKSAVVVLSVTRDGTGDAAIYRGRSVGLNWWGAISEYKAALKRALDEALRPLNKELKKACSVEPAG